MGRHGWCFNPRHTACVWDRWPIHWATEAVYLCDACMNQGKAKKVVSINSILDECTCANGMSCVWTCMYILVGDLWGVQIWYWVSMLCCTYLVKPQLQVSMGTGLGGQAHTHRVSVAQSWRMLRHVNLLCMLASGVYLHTPSVRRGLYKCTWCLRPQSHKATQHDSRSNMPRTRTCIYTCIYIILYILACSN